MSQKKVSMLDSADVDDSEKAQDIECKGKSIEKKFNSLIWEKRILILAFVTGVLATLLFIVSFSTEFWIYVRYARPQERDDSRGKYLKIGHYQGLWKICKEELWNRNQTTSREPQEEIHCEKMFYSLPANKYLANSEREKKESKILDCRRATIAVGFSAIVLAFLADGFTFYSLDQLRYMYKRLAGCLHLLAGASCWVTLEVFRQTYVLVETTMQEYVTEFLEVKFGWSYNLIWFDLILFIIPGIILLVCSKKKKRGKARSLKEARENEPVFLGR